MENLSLVGMLDALQDLHGHLDRLELVDHLLPVEQAFEALALHVLHDDEERSVDLLRGQDGDDVGVVEGGEETGLLEEIVLLPGLAVGDLDRDPLVDPGVAGEENRAESARAQVLEDLIFPDILAQQKHARRRVYEGGYSRNRPFRSLAICSSVSFCLLSAFIIRDAPNATGR